MVFVPTRRRTALLGLSRGYLDTSPNSVGHVALGPGGAHVGIALPGPASDALLAMVGPYEENFPVLLELSSTALAETCIHTRGPFSLWSGAIAADRVVAIHVRSERDFREMRARDYDGLGGASLPLSISPDLLGSGPAVTDRDEIDGLRTRCALPPLGETVDIDKVAALVVALMELGVEPDADNPPPASVVELDWQTRPSMAPAVLATAACSLLAGPASSPAEVWSIVNALMGSPSSSGLDDVVRRLSAEAGAHGLADDWSAFLELAMRFADDDPAIGELGGALLPSHRGALLLWSCAPDPALACAEAWPGCGADKATRILAAGYSALMVGLDATLRQVRDRRRYAEVIDGLVRRINRRTAAATT